MDEDVIAQWAPAPLWELAAALLPAAPVRPQGGGRRRVDDRRAFAAMLYLIQTGCSWWQLPEKTFGVTRPTAHRRFTEWTAAGFWGRLHDVLADRLADDVGSAWAPALTEAIAAQAEKARSGRSGRVRPGGRPIDPR
ncbi:transposase [Planosporangium sp. 12N6]|uniref:transposase n=1 Tax=Planosporangium spinosum TaxID=3402278 RepID=UPI003CF23D03